MKMEIWDLYDYLKSNIPTDPQLRVGYQKAIEDIGKRIEGVLCRGEGRQLPSMDKLNQRDFDFIFRHYYPKVGSVHKEKER